MTVFSITAPIIPYVSMGNIKLGSNIDDVVSELKKNNLKICHRNGGGQLKEFYDIEQFMTIGFMTKNRKIDSLYSNVNYKGGINNQIYVGMTLEEVKDTDSSLVYMDSDDEYLSLNNGYIIRLEDNGWIDLNVIEITLEMFFPSVVVKSDRTAKYNYLKNNVKQNIWKSGDW